MSGGGEAANAAGNNSTTEFVNVRQHTTTTVSPVTQHYHDTAILTATVTPAGVSGSVEFFVNGASVGLGSYNSVTGVATFAYVVQLATGSYNLRAEFTSAEILYLDSAHTLVNGLTVTHEENTLTYTGQTVIANGGTATMSAFLQEDGPNDDDGDGGGPPIAGRTIHFTLGTGVTAQTCDAVTNLLGVASCAISPVAQPLGPGIVTAEFAGDAFYQPSSDSAATILFAFLDHGSFALGNLAAAVGQRRPRSGARNGPGNALSGGAAPNSFKGFVNGLSTTPPACGGTWTTARRQQRPAAGRTTAVVHGRGRHHVGDQVGPDHVGQRRANCRGANQCRLRSGAGTPWHRAHRRDLLPVAIRLFVGSPGRSARPGPVPITANFVGCDPLHISVRAHGARTARKCRNASRATPRRHCAARSLAATRATPSIARRSRPSTSRCARTEIRYQSASSCSSRTSGIRL